MEDKCIHIIKTKSYHSLNNEEKKLIIKWCKNEDEFVSLKNLLIGVESYKEKNISKTKNEIKNSLDDLFNDIYKTNKSSKKSFIKTLFPESKAFYFKPGFQIAAVLVLAFLAIPKILDLNIDSNSNKIAKTNVTRQKTKSDKKSTQNLKEPEHSDLKEIKESKKDTLISKQIKKPLNNNVKITSNMNHDPIAGRNGTIAINDTHEIVELIIVKENNKNDRLIVNPVIDNPEILDLLSPTF